MEKRIEGNSDQIETSYLPVDLQFRIVRFEDKVDYNSLKLHRHNYLEIFFFVKGGGTHLIDFQEYGIKDSQLHFVFANQIHLVKRKDDAHGFVILFKADFLNIQQGNPMQEFYGKFFHSPVLSPDKEEVGILNSIFTLLQNEYNSSGAEYNRAMLKYYLNAFLLQCLRYKSNDVNSDKSLSDSDHQICNQLNHLIEQHFAQQKDLGFYEGMLNIGYKKLAIATKKVFGKSPKLMVNERLNLEIKRKLLYTKDSIKEIAVDLSFNEPSHLTKFFIRYNEQNPSDFRDNWVKKYKP